jgi:FK506-binding nuclear protein
MANNLTVIQRENRSGSRLEKGKLLKVFTSEVLLTSGWDIGLEGIQLGGERKITIPAAMAYGSKKILDIPVNSDLVFEVKCVALN